MNIFVTDINPYVAARNLCDIHLNKMIIESCQLLSTNLRIKYGDEACDDKSKVQLYKSMYVNHPCRKCLETEYNEWWLRHHLNGLLKEYTYRRNRTHGCQGLFNDWFDPKWNYNDIELITEYNIESIESTSFIQCMPDEYKVLESNDQPSTDITKVAQAYRNYYKFKKSSLSRWNYTNREEPNWLND